MASVATYDELIKSFDDIVTYIQKRSNVGVTNSNKFPIDRSILSRILAVENSYAETPFVLWEKLRGTNELVESIKWIKDYICTDFNENHLNSCSTFGLNKNALIVKILIPLVSDVPKPLFFLTTKANLIFRNVLKNHISGLSEHNTLKVNEFFYRNFNEDRLLKIIKRWNPLLSAFETYLYEAVKMKKGNIVKKIDPDIDKNNNRGTNSTDYKRKGEFIGYDVTESNFDLEVFYKLLHWMIFKSEIRPHKLIFFYVTTDSYSFNTNIDAVAFFNDNRNNRLVSLYNSIYENSKYWEIRGLLEEFYNTKLVKKIRDIYNSNRKDDSDIKRQVGEEQIENVIVEVFFNNCRSNSNYDLKKVGQRLSSWNKRLRDEVIRNRGNWY